MLPEPLQAARLQLAAQRPYLAAALWALVPVERPGLGTLAADRWWRLYFDPAVCSAWTVEQLAGALYHKVCHLLRAHPERAEAIPAEAAAWNLAADAEINDDLYREGVSLPGQPVTPATLGQPEKLLAEEYYFALLRAQQSAPRQGASAQPPQGDGGAPEAGGSPDQGDGQRAGPQAAAKGDDPAGDAAESAQDGAPSSAAGRGGEEEASSPSPTTEGGGHADGAQEDAGGGAPPPQPGTPSASEAGDDGGSTPSSSSAQAGDASGRSGAPSGPAPGPVSGSAGGRDGIPSSAGAQAPAPGAGRCGSCAHGQREPWEDPAPSEGGAPGLSRAEGEIVRRQVAEAIRIAAASDSRGTIPGYWKRWAEEKLRPRVNWRRELAALIRHAAADAAGAADYSYRRPSRRQAASEAILPALRQPVPEVAVVVDTSGSVSDAMLAQALAEVAGVLRACGLRQSVHVLAVDAQVHTCRRVFRPKQVRLAGGGGTDMGAGIEAALRLRPRPQVVIVLTDGYTPWPAEPPRGVRVVVGIIEGSKISAPSWARVVEVKSDG